jgi:1-acyl-sn-glycerol-3-phosphate acyltransferase
MARRHLSSMEIPEPGPLVPRRGGRLRAALGRGLLRLLGWRIADPLPDLPRAVITVAPHSSNWDFIIGIATVFALRLDARWIGKAELFRGPLGPVMRWLGGLPVRRDQPEGFVEEVVRRFREHEQLLLAVAPEGTRKPVTRWKSGFYRIALGAGVPIVPAMLDNAVRAVRFGEPRTPGPDLEAGIGELRVFYEGVARR